MPTMPAEYARDEDPIPMPPSDMTRVKTQDFR